jgi:tetratricopeptide (TPR) repeat protein
MLDFGNCQVPPPCNWQDFESLCRDLWSRIWGDKNAQTNGRNGQQQNGVDIFGRDNVSGELQGIQCKLKNNRLGGKITNKELLEEVEKAKRFKPKLAKFILATTAQSDARIQEKAREITENNMRKNLFSVHVFGWDDICKLIKFYPELIASHYGLYSPKKLHCSIEHDIIHDNSSYVPCQLPAIINWCGRIKEVAELSNLFKSRIQADGPGSIEVLGGPGMGKTRLVSYVCNALIGQMIFDKIAWVSLRIDPSTGSVPSLDIILETVIAKMSTEMSDKCRLLRTDQKINLVVNALTTSKSIMVIDDIESVLEDCTPSRTGYFKNIYNDYRNFIKMIVQRNDKSVVVFISREKIAELHIPWCFSYGVFGLDKIASVELLKKIGLCARDDVLERLAFNYSGNPKALEVVAPFIMDHPHFNGNVEIFLNEHQSIIIQDLEFLLHEVFIRLSSDEHLLLRRISVYNTTSVPLSALAIEAQVPHLSKKYLIDNLILSLVRRKLLEKCSIHGFYFIHPIVQEMSYCELVGDREEYVFAHCAAYNYFRNSSVNSSQDWQSIDEICSLVAAVRHACMGGEWLSAAEIACEQNFRRSLVKWGAHSQILDIYSALRNAPKGVEDNARSDAKALRAISANMLGIALRNFGRANESILIFKESLAEADEKWHAILLGNLCLALIDSGDYCEAINVGSNAYNHALSIKDFRAAGYAQGNIGIAYFKLNNFKMAKIALMQDLWLADKENVEGQAHAHAVLGLIAMGEHKMSKALVRFLLAIIKFRSLGNEFRELEFLPKLGEVLVKTHEIHGAAICFQRCNTLSLSLKSVCYHDSFLDEFDYLFNNVELGNMPNQDVYLNEILHGQCQSSKLYIRYQHIYC